jgi:hypothetical protein
MRTNQHTGEQNTENRTELAQRYFTMFGEGIGGVYKEGNMGIITLLSDLQEEIAMNIKSPRKAEHYRVILNDIKCILIKDDQVVRMNKDLADDDVVRIVGRDSL